MIPKRTRHAVHWFRRGNHDGTRINFRVKCLVPEAIVVYSRQFINKPVVVRASCRCLSFDICRPRGRVIVGMLWLETVCGNLLVVVQLSKLFFDISALLKFKSTQRLCEFVVWVILIANFSAFL